MRTFTICSLSNVLFPLLWWSLHFPIELWPVLSSSAPNMVCTCVQFGDNLSRFSPKRKEIVLSSGKILQSEEHPINLKWSFCLLFLTTNSPFVLGAFLYQGPYTTHLRDWSPWPWISQSFSMSLSMWALLSLDQGQFLAFLLESYWGILGVGQESLSPLRDNFQGAPVL